jgi:cellulose synthase/poly-beta-1,6-N-acetylglucosamine synthase-like glycosyltransferase
MLTTLNHIGMAVHLLCLALLYLLASPAIRSARQAWQERRRIPAPHKMPSMAMIVPLTGNAPGMAKSLSSLLQQPGVFCPTYFVVSNEEDPAVPLVQGLMPQNPQARLVVAGEARICCQKNHSLLAGIDAANADFPGEGPDILVFCDSTHEAAPDFLVRLTAPILAGKALLTTAYHRIVPKDGGLATLCQFFSALGIHLLQSLPILCQPWGGATAIPRHVFFSNGVDAIWARGIVDDFTMGPYLQSRGIRALAVPEASLITPLAGQTLEKWLSWWFRQLLYLKFCMPFTWLAATIGVLGISGVMMWAAYDAITGGIIGWLYFLSLGGMGIVFGTLAQTHQPPWRFAISFVMMQALSVLCFFATWGTNTLRWRDRSYKARLDGTVEQIVTSPPS